MRQFLDNVCYGILGVLIGVVLTVASVALVAALGGCATTRPQPADVPTLSVHQDSLRRDSLAQLPAYLVPPPAGSTKRQARQWQKAQAENLARAGHAPAVVKVKNSTIAAANSTVVSTAKNSSAAVGQGATSTQIDKAKGPVATAPTATAQDFGKATKGGGALVVGDKSSAEATTKKGFPWWILIVLGILAALLGLNRFIRGRWFL